MFLTDSSQSESLSDGEDQRPSFSKPSVSNDASGGEASQSGNDFSMYNSVSQKLMVICLIGLKLRNTNIACSYSKTVLQSLFSCFQAKMGFKEGEGLGKFGQGRREIVEASTQRGRRGLGLMLQGFEGDLNVEWKDETEVGTVLYTHRYKPVCPMFLMCEILY